MLFRSDVSFCCHWPVSPGCVDFKNVKCGSWQTGGIAAVQHGEGPELGLICQLFALLHDEISIKYIESMCLETFIVI